MLLADLLRGYPLAGPAPHGSVTGVAYDTRRLMPGEVFVAIKGARADAHERLEDAIAAGASALVVDAAWLAAHPREWLLPVAASPDTRLALAELAARYWEEPSTGLALVGVTGTNGKTTTTHMIEAILQEAGHTTGLIGTLGSRIGAGTVPTGHTTPMAADLQALLARMKQGGVTHAVMEVSSHALDQHRTGATRFAVGVFTNLTPDHLDYHETMEAYGAAKARLFSGLPRDGRALVNLDDPAAPTMMGASTAPVWTYSATGNPAADLRAEEADLHATGSQWDLVTPLGKVAVRLKLPGRFNVANALAAAGTALALGVDLPTIARGLGRMGGVPGRVEVVSPADCPFSVLVDYAHTPDGLTNVLTTARAFTRGRLLVVFGCGGDRDQTKRPVMGEIASTLADIAIVTSDNPRSEDPRAIADAIVAGMQGEPVVELDRARAIRRAVELAQPGDVLVIAGKGHETTQTLGTEVLPFDDREHARQALAERAVPR